MSIDLSRIRVELIEHERWRRSLAFEVPADVMQREHEDTLSEAARRLKLPGFPKGRAPFAAIEREHGERLRQETLQRVIGEAYPAALAERQVQPISQGEVEFVEFKPPSPLTFRVSFDVEPAVELSRLSGFQLVRPSVHVQPSDVERELRHLLEQHAIWRPPDDGGGPRDGDLVTVQIVPLGEAAEAAGSVGLPWARRLRLRPNSAHRGRYQLVLGAGDALPDLEKAVRTLIPGETGEFTILDDALGEGPAREVRLRVTLEDRRMRELPDLDDNFARSLGEFDSVDALRARVRADLEEEAWAEAERTLWARLLEQLLLANPFDVPRSLVERHLKSLQDNTMASGAGDPAREETGLVKQAEIAAKRALFVSRVAESKSLEATPGEIDRRIAELAVFAQATPSEVRARLLESNRLQALASEITERKVFEFLLEQSEVTPGR